MFFMNDKNVQCSIYLRGRRRRADDIIIIVENVRSIHAGSRTQDGCDGELRLPPRRAVDRYRWYPVDPVVRSLQNEMRQRRRKKKKNTQSVAICLHRFFGAARGPYNMFSDHAGEYGQTGFLSRAAAVRTYTL